MEIQEGMPKTVVFGIGGAGCKTLNLIAKENLACTELIAIDVDKKQLYSLDGSIKQILVGESIAECSSFEEVKSALKEEIGVIENSLEGAGIAIIIAGLGRKTGTCIVNFIAELCGNKGLLTLTIPIYPFVTKKGRAAEANAIVKKLKEFSTAVIIVDNNLKRTHRTMSVLDVFRVVNSFVVKMVRLLVNSVCGMNSMNLSVEELRYFFHGDLVNIMAVSEANGLEAAAERALKDLHRYVENSSIKKMLILATSAYETSVDDMKSVNGIIQGGNQLEDTKWISAIDSSKNTMVMLVAGVSELPLVEGVVMPDRIDSEEKEVIELEDKTFEEVGGGSKFPALVGMHLLETPKLVKGRKPKTGGTKREGPIARDEEADTIKKAGKRVRPRVEGEDIEEIASDLAGFPLFKKKGQKTIKEYTDEFGIEYI